MTITIEVKPELAHCWRAIAEREGRALEAVAAQAAEAGTDALESNGASSIARALALLDELTPVIQAGTRRDAVPLDAAAELREMREEHFADAS